MEVFKSIQEALSNKTFNYFYLHSEDRVYAFIELKEAEIEVSKLDNSGTGFGLTSREVAEFISELIN